MARRPILTVAAVRPACTPITTILGDASTAVRITALRSNAGAASASRWTSRFASPLSVTSTTGSGGAKRASAGTSAGVRDQRGLRVGPAVVTEELLPRPVDPRAVPTAVHLGHGHDEPLAGRRLERAARKVRVDETGRGANQLDEPGRQRS